MSFEKGQRVIYMRSRHGGKPAQDIRAIYDEEVQFSYRERRHRIAVALPNGGTKELYVGLDAIKPEPSP